MLKSVNKDKMHKLYMNAFNKTFSMYLDNPDADFVANIKKLIVYGVKAVNSKPKPEIITREEAGYNFHLVEVIKSLMANLTPVEFMNLFPARKDYDGHKYECKDYFSTMEYIKKLVPNNPIGAEIDNFLWDYMNTETHVFLVNVYGAVSDMRQLNGHPGLMEQWAQENGIKTYAMHTDDKGREYLLDRETGKTMKVKRPKPRYLKVVRPGGKQK